LFQRFTEFLILRPISVLTILPIDRAAQNKELSADIVKQKLKTWPISDFQNEQKAKPSSSQTVVM
jgi:hypothetical protein